MQSGTSRRERLFTQFGKVRSALVLSGVMGLALVGLAAGLAPQANAAGNLVYRYQPGYYLDNGWLCYGWSNGVYHCTQHWHRDSSGHLVSDNAKWVPNHGTGSAAATHSATAPVKAAQPVAKAPAKPAAKPAPKPAARPAAPAAPAAAPASGGSVQDMIRSTFGPYAGAALNVAACESGYNPNAYNAGSGASGVFQFLHSTWLTTSYAGYSPFNASANIHAAYQVFSRDGFSWHEWQCQP